ncbi:hypothetical protein EVAR_77562_1 [Eumeta japonica]|uniref:Uncharacterized protein n=1 Tax=Eumeta variegata TaxID=151549 RepID=A0A4C1T6N4_EUMVA|nr:hypothetical protein EVAR_77562_1 [Eumeta japonica]
MACLQIGYHHAWRATPHGALSTDRLMGSYLTTSQLSLAKRTHRRKSRPESGVEFTSRVRRAHEHVQWNINECSVVDPYCCRIGLSTKRVVKYHTLTEYEVASSAVVLFVADFRVLRVPDDSSERFPVLHQIRPSLSRTRRSTSPVLVADDVTRALELRDEDVAERIFAANGHENNSAKDRVFGQQSPPARARTLGVRVQKLQKRE